jgi:hypothetical protein
VRVSIIAIVACAGCHSAASATGDAAIGDAAADAAAARTFGLVQNVQTIATTATITLPLTPTRLGNLVVIATANIDSQTPAESVIDNAANTYAAIPASYACTKAGSLRGQIFYGVVTNAGATMVAITSPGGVRREVWVLELAGVTTLDVSDVLIDVQAVGTAKAPAIAPTRFPAIIVSIATVPASVVATLPPFTNLPKVNGDGCAYAAVSTAGSYGAEWTIDSNGAYCALSAAFVE